MTAFVLCLCSIHRGLFTSREPITLYITIYYNCSPLGSENGALINFFKYSGNTNNTSLIERDTNSNSSYIKYRILIYLAI